MIQIRLNLFYLNNKHLLFETQSQCPVQEHFHQYFLTIEQKHCNLRNSIDKNRIYGIIILDQY
jgi:hypothetical protein